MQVLGSFTVLPVCIFTDYCVSTRLLWTLVINVSSDRVFTQCIWVMNCRVMSLAIIPLSMTLGNCKHGKDGVRHGTAEA